MAKKTKTTIDIPSIWTKDRVNSAIKECGSLFGPGSKNLALLHDTAFQCMYHARIHRDVTLGQNLYRALGGSEKDNQSFTAIRVEAMKLWFGKFAPITARGGVWKLTEDYKAVDKDDEAACDPFWKLEEALKTPFWTLEPDRSGRDVDFEALMNIIAGVVKRIDRAQEQGTYKGDATKAKAWAENVIAFAKKSATGMSDKDKGTEDDNNKIIKSAVEKNARLTATKRSA